MAANQSILKKLYDGRIFGIAEVDGKFEFVEQCDHWFSVELTREELIQLSNELRDMAFGQSSSGAPIISGS